MNNSTLKMPQRSVSYSVRIALVVAALAIATIAAIVFAPQVPDVSVVDTQPFGVAPTLESPIRVTFSRPVDKRSAERAFVLYPPARGRLSWPDEQTLLFTPSEPLRPGLNYRVIIRPGLRDLRGYQNRAETAWLFRTPEE
jgi:hypothetical protein